MLRTWDLRWSATSIPTSLAVFWGTEMQRGGGRGGAENAPPDQMLRALSAASDRLTADFGTWKTPWGNINRFQRLTADIVHPFNDAGPSIPVPFTAATWGSLASFSARAVSDDEEVVRDQRQQLRRRRRVRTESPRQGRHRRRRERRPEVTALQRPGAALRDGQPSRRVLLQGPAAGAHEADLPAGQIAAPTSTARCASESSRRRPASARR